MENISVFDADACIIMGIPINNTDRSLLLELIEYFDYSYIHETVYNEVGRGFGQKAHLEYLVEKGFIELINDEHLLNRLLTVFNNEEICCSYYCDLLKSNIEIMKPKEKKILREAYKGVLETKYKEINILLGDIKSVEDSIVNGSSVGELKTTLLVELLSFIGVADINYFVSNDNRARLLMLQSSAGKVRACSPMGTFIMLKQAGLDEVTARKYLKKAGKCRNEKIIDINDNKVTKQYRDIFNDIYNVNNNIELQADGTIKYV